MKIKRDWIAFDELSSKDKRFRASNLGLLVILMIATISFLIHFIVIGDPNNRIVASIAIFIFAVMPYAVERLVGKRLNNFLFLLYLIYLFFAGFLGCVLNFYNTSFLNLKNWYDALIHILAGYWFCFVGMFVLARVEKYEKLNVWTIVLFAFSFTLATELIWELFERFADIFLGQTAQGVKVEGTNSPLLADTMLDILCNFLGGLIFVGHYIIGKKTKFSLGLDFLENEIVYNSVLQSQNSTVNEFQPQKEKFMVDILLGEEDENIKKHEE